jgi:MscS family membrane protein
MELKYSQMIAYIKRLANHDIAWFFEFLNQYAWSVEVMMILLVTLLLAYLEHVMYHKLHPEFMKKKKLWQHAFIHALHRPLFFLIWLVGISFSLELVVNFFSKSNINLFLPTLRKVGVLSLIILFAITYIQEIERLFLSRKDDSHFVDKTTIRAVGQIMRIIVLLGGAFFILQTTLGVGASAVVAFAGGGSFIIGWAAKDMLANIFGGFMIFLDRPFVIGDKISTLDKEFEGYVEQIGWRLTCIRTLEKVPVYIPNSFFSNTSIQNPSRMTHRRIYATIGLRHQDGSKMPAILQDIETMLKEHSDLDPSEPTYANFSNLGQNALDVLICGYTYTTNLQEFYRVRQDIFFKIMDIIASHGAMCAYPVTEGHLKVSVENS